MLSNDSFYAHFLGQHYPRFKQSKGFKHEHQVVGPLWWETCKFYRQFDGFRVCYCCWPAWLSSKKFHQFLFPQMLSTLKRLYLEVSRSLQLNSIKIVFVQAASNLDSICPFCGYDFNRMVRQVKCFLWIQYLNQVHVAETWS